MKYTAIALAIALAAFNASANDELLRDIDSLESLDSAMELEDESIDEEFNNLDDLDANYEIPSEAEPLMTASDEEATFGTQSSTSVEQVKDPRSEITTAINNYKVEVESQLNEAGRNHLVSLSTGYASIPVDKVNPDWSRYRANAIRRAVANAKQSHLMDLNSSVRNRVVMEFFSDEGAPTPSVDDFKTQSKMGSVIQKAVALMESKLDSALEEEGINPDEFNSASQAKKQELMRDHFAEETISEAFGDMSGMFVIKTFESYNDSGKGYVGVVLAKSIKKRDQLKALVESKGQVKPDASLANPQFENVQAALSSNQTPYLEYGTAIEYDDKGYPMIISYGQAGVKYNNNDRLMDKKRKAAFKQARANAMANLAQSYSMSGDYFEKITEQRTEVQEAIHTLSSSTSVTTMDTGVVDTLRTVVNEATKMTASIKGLNGLRTMNTWNMPHPITGHEMVGVAIVWHPVQVQHAELMQSGRALDEVESAKEKPISTNNVTTQQSKSRFNAADF